jgi:hypothetical protein
MASARELAVDTSAKTGHRWSWTVPLALAIVIFLILSLWLAHTKAPWCDEGWFANPAYNLALKGLLQFFPDRRVAVVGTYSPPSPSD